MRKAMIVLGVALVFCGALAGCKKKSEEEQIGELVEKLGEAKTEQEATEIVNKIEKKEQRAEKKHIKEINVKLGEPFSVWQHGFSPSDPQKKSEFRITFKDPVRYRVQAWGRPVDADKGKKFFGIIAKIENLGPRESDFGRNAELKVDKGFIYRLEGNGNIVNDPEGDYYPYGVDYRLEPGKTGWLLLGCQIPEDTYPVEVFGKLGEGSSYYAPGYTKFRLKLTQFGGHTNERKEEMASPFRREISKKNIIGTGRVTRSSIAGDYTAITIMSDGKEYKSPCVSTWKEDGTGLNKFAGKWEIRDNELELHVSRDTTLVGGQITTDTLYREPPAVSLTKQRNARVIKKLETGNILWSEYYFTGGRLTQSLEIKKDGTFQEIMLFRNAWRIKDGVVEITVTDKNQKKKQLKGKIEADTIVFKDGETEIRFVRQDSFPVSSVGLLKAESTLQRKETSGLERIDPSEMLWVKCKNPSCETEYQIAKDWDMLGLGLIFKF